MFGLDIILSAIPMVLGTGAIVCGVLKYYNVMPTLTPEIVIVRAPYGYPENKVREEMMLLKETTHFTLGPLHYMKYPITEHKDIERAMIEMGRRMSWYSRYFNTAWFVIHSPKIEYVGILETLAITHGYRVNIMDIPIPMKDGFPKQVYYKWAKSNPYVCDDEDMIQHYFSSWLSWSNTGSSNEVSDEEQEDEAASESSSAAINKDD